MDTTPTSRVWAGSFGHSVLVWSIREHGNRDVPALFLLVYLANCHYFVCHYVKGLRLPLSGRSSLSVLREAAGGKNRGRRPRYCVPIGRVVRTRRGAADAFNWCRRLLDRVLHQGEGSIISTKWEDYLKKCCHV